MANKCRRPTGTGGGHNVCDECRAWIFRVDGIRILADAPTFKKDTLRRPMVRLGAGRPRVLHPQKSSGSKLLVLPFVPLATGFNFDFFDFLAFFSFLGALFELGDPAEPIWPRAATSAPANPPLSGSARLVAPLELELGSCGLSPARASDPPPEGRPAVLPAALAPAAAWIGSTLSSLPMPAGECRA